MTVLVADARANILDSRDTSHAQYWSILTGPSNTVGVCGQLFSPGPWHVLSFVLWNPSGTLPPSGVPHMWCSISRCFSLFFQSVDGRFLGCYCHWCRWVVRFLDQWWLKSGHINKRMYGWFALCKGPCEWLLCAGVLECVSGRHGKIVCFSALSEVLTVAEAFRTTLLKHLSTGKVMKVHREEFCATSWLRGAAIFFEFKHYKPKKKKISTRHLALRVHALVREQ